ncbi:MAG: sarcosine oxidase subunit alpha family protein [Alphaproteobacteria bacterium]|nr:sarcosine oxidase subunit alpha family protein [Alphaproteobacteria bacterium]
MSQVNRLESGGRIDRDRPVTFTFDGKRYAGFDGDTVASALLANDVHLVGRSYKYHRPRGILSAGAEEPNALLQLGRGARSDPNTRATVQALYDGLVADSQNRWPNLKFDIGEVNNVLSRLLPAGFYYKTFMWPPSQWETYEHGIRRAAGLGKAPTGPDPDRYEAVHAHCDVLVVGGGPAGLAAAAAAGANGARVIVADEQAEIGGWLLTDLAAKIDGAPALDWVAAAREKLAAMAEVRVLPRTTITGYYDHNFLVGVERVTDHLGTEPDGHIPRQRFWRIRAKQVVLACGALERPLVFPQNDRPGVMLAGAVRSYVNRYAVRPGREALVVTNNDSAYRTALDLRRAGAKVTIADLRPDEYGPLRDLVREAGIDVLPGNTVTSTSGRLRVDRAAIQELDAAATGVVGSPISLGVDLVAMSGGWNPTVHLFSQSRGKLRYDEGLGTFVPDHSPQAVRSAGACNGAGRLAEALTEGFAAGRAAAADAGFGKGKTPKTPPVEEIEESPKRVLSILPGGRRTGRSRKRFVDFQNDVTAADVHLAAREGYVSVEHLKRYTTTGMGTDQGKTSNLNALAIMADIREAAIPEVGHTTYRPPYTPLTFGAVAGRNSGHLFDPVRKTPMHPWHVANGAVFEDVGQWKRPRYFPRGNETMGEAVRRECAEARESVGILDAGTLGKIDIQGPDAADFLNMVYTNAWTKLGVNRCRYGLMLNEHGMVFDDGVTTRLGDNHFHMTTTTGGAARVLSWLEEWLQTEWPEMRVYCTSVTEQWAVATISGPNSRALLAELTDLDLVAEAFPFMAVQDGTVAGVPARIYRISFTGDLSYEINVPARYGLGLWQALMAGGQKYGICPYGTETMHVLRAEKGFIIVGQDSDGTVTPYDLGMDWIVSKTKPDFFGKRSLSRPDTAREGRKQLVGLLTENPDFVLPEGAHLVDEVLPQPPMKTIGHVTSSYDTPNVGRSIALALVENGRARMGETLHAPLLGGRVEAVTVADPVFFDKEGERARG